MSLVINYDLPTPPENYLPRYVRSGRFRRNGVAINVVTRDDEQMILQRQLAMGLRKEDGGAVPRSAFDMIDDRPAGTAAHPAPPMGPAHADHVRDAFPHPTPQTVRPTPQPKPPDLSTPPRPRGRLG